MKNVGVECRIAASGWYLYVAMVSFSR